MNEVIKRRLRLGISLVNFLVIIPAVLVSGVLLGDRNYAVTSTIIVVLSLVPFFLLFENRKMKARELIPIAVMTAIAVVGRAAFYFLPQFKPIVAIIIITGIAFGKEAGFLSGALAMLCSNFMFGQGPWTPWQMFACGLIGYISGILGSAKCMKKIWLLCIWGFLSCLLYGFFVDTWSLIGFANNVTWGSIVSVYSLGLPFNLILAVATTIFLAILARPLLEKLERIKIKYGLIQSTAVEPPGIESFKIKEIKGFDDDGDDSNDTNIENK